MNSDTRDVLEEIREDSRGIDRTECDPPNEEQVSYPEDMDAIGRVEYVLVNESLVERSIDWIAGAADVSEEDCETILKALATIGVAIPPEGSYKTGWQINPYYKDFAKRNRDIQRLKKQHSFPRE